MHTHDNHNEINNNGAGTNAIEADSCSGTNGLLTSDFGSSTRGERQNSERSSVIILC